MNRFISTGAGFALFLSVLAPAALAQDTIHYLDAKTKKETTATGTIQEENAGAVVYKPGTAAGTKEIAAPDIIDVDYEVPGKVKLVLRSASGDERRVLNPGTKEAERRTALADALKNYQAVLAELDRSKQKFAARHIQYKIAQLQARQAEEDPALTDAAIEALVDFVKSNADGWQI